MKQGKTLKIGWLIPHSSLFRQLRHDLQQAFVLAVEEQLPDLRIEYFPEYIYSGSAKDSEDAVRKLLQYHDVDLVVGVMSTKTAIPIIPLLESRQKPAFLLNLGADTPGRQLSSDYLFYNSLHLWKSEWAIGKWAQEKWGGTPSINLSVYEGGYSLHEPFRLGTAASGAASVHLNIDSNISGPPDTLHLVQYLETQCPAHAHALLSGKEGDQFIQLFEASGIQSRTALTVNPFMVEDGVLKQDISGLDLYNACTWSQSLDTDLNQSFVNTYTTTYDAAPTAFGLLAYETGLVIANAITQTGSLNPEKLRQAFGESQPVGPRGKLALSTRPLQTLLPIYIRKPSMDNSTGSVVNTIVEQAEGIEWNAPNFVSEQDLMTGWQNPYLCV